MKKSNQSTKTMYSVRCTECGELIEGKFFPLDNLLRQYSLPGQIAYDRDEMIRVLGIGATYGQCILPKVDALLKKIENEGEKNWEVVVPDLKKTGAAPACFTCKNNNEIPVNKLSKVELNIASMVAQFCISTGFYDFYEMLSLELTIRQMTDRGESADNQKKQLNQLCARFAVLPGVHLTELTTQDLQQEQIHNVLMTILRFAQIEAEESGRQHFANETLKAGWRYQEVNGVQMPYALVVMGSSGEAYHCTECCCDKCRRQLPYEMGAYPQKIVGILGTQATGKTTYLAALADAIDQGEATSFTKSNGDRQHTNISITHTFENDPQWERVQAEPVQNASGKVKVGTMWLYQNGYPPQKTQVQTLEAPALTFLVGTPSGKVMYTLADIPGEAFTGDEQYGQYVEKMRKLLYSSSALIMVISTSQMMDGNGAELNQDLIRDPNKILTCYQDFLPKEPIPTAVVMTSADKVNNGDLRKVLNLAYDIRKCRPLVWDGRKGYLVYNAEAMSGSVQAVRGYINKYFGNFMENLSHMLKSKGPQSPKLEAFAISSGTQCAPKDFLDAADADYHSDAQREARCARVRQERFGIVAPLLWLLACDGVLEIGRADTEYNNYASAVQKKIDKYLCGTL